MHLPHSDKAFASTSVHLRLCISAPLPLDALFLSRQPFVGPVAQASNDINPPLTLSRTQTLSWAHPLCTSLAAACVPTALITTLPHKVRTRTL